jgi:hypothetical protein
MHEVCNQRGKPESENSNVRRTRLWRAEPHEDHVIHPIRKKLSFEFSREMPRGKERPDQIATVHDVHE